VSGVATARRDLGRQLAAARKAAGYTQGGLAAALGYSRSTVSNAEIGHPDVARAFWAGCDRVLRNGRAFTTAFDQLKAAERRQAAGLPETVPDTALQAFRRARRLITASAPAEALAGYRELGWAAESREGCQELVTGTVLDAFELPPAAAMLAVALWQYSQGRADEVLRLPALPRPGHALAVISTGDRCFFLAAAGSYPWPAEGTAAAAAGEAPGAVIRWHSAGCRIPAPPSQLPGGRQAAWEQLPSGPLRLAPSIALLSLLAVAAATAAPGPAVRTLPGGVRVMPVPRPCDGGPRAR